MISIPAINPQWRVIIPEDEGVVLLSEQEEVTLRNPLVRQVMQHIDGTRSSHEIVTALAAKVEPAPVWYVLGQLESKGHIVEAADPDDCCHAAFWTACGVDSAKGNRRLAKSSARILSCDVRCGEQVAEALKRFGVSALSVEPLSSPDPATRVADLHIAIVSEYLSDKLVTLAREARSAGRQLLLVRPFGIEAWIGPLLNPDSTACLDCLRRRLLERRPVLGLALFDEPDRESTYPLAGPRPVVETACLAAATEAARALAGGSDTLEGKLLSINAADRRTALHHLIGHPACQNCASGNEAPAVEVRLLPRQRTGDGGGGFRSRPAQEVFNTYGHLLGPVLGIASSLTQLAESFGTGFAYAADNTLGGRARSLKEMIGLRSFYSMGKGVTDADARASALGEVAEHYSGRFHGTEARLQGSYAELGGDAIHPNRVANYSDRQYRERESWNRKTSPRNRIPWPFDPEAVIDWTPIWSLTRKRQRLLPTEMLYFGPLGQGRAPGDHGYFYGCPNGCASGSNLEEAVLQAFLELIERDAVSIWWFNRIRRPAVDLASFDDQWLSSLPTLYKTVGRTIEAIDLTSDLAIPVFAVTSRELDECNERVVLGFGCHLDARIALRRACTEMYQMLAFDLAGRSWTDRELHDWLKAGRVSEHAYLIPDPELPVSKGSDFPARPPSCMLEAIEHCRRTVESKGMEVLVLDQTRKDIGMNVARVVVPGLRQMRVRLAPGRLYDVPVGQGWLDEPIPEQDLNPLPVFW